MKKITAEWVRKLTPRSKRYTISEENLQATVHPTGRVVFNSYTQIKGRQTKRPLSTFPSNRIDAGQLEQLRKVYADHYLDYMGGKLPDTPMEEARKQRETKKALDRKRQHAEHEAHEKRRLEDGGWALYSQENPEDATFGLLFEEWSRAEGSEKKSAYNDECIFNKDLADLQPVPLFAIDRTLLIEVLKKVNGKVQPNRVRSLLSKVFNWAVDNNYLEVSPATRLPRNKENSRHRILSDKEIPKAWKVMRPIHKFLLCTGQRREEVALMRWSQLDGNRWTIPETKNSYPHTLLLPSFAMKWLPEAIEGRDCIWQRTKGKFDNHVHKDTVSDWWGEARGEAKLDDVTVHDFRRTVITNLTRVTGDDTIGRKVANQTLQGVDARYNLYAWDDEKATALKKWNRLLRKLVE